MLPCNQSLPFSVTMNLTRGTVDTDQILCNTSDSLKLNHNTTKSLPIALEESFSCGIKLHENYAGNIYSVGDKSEQYKLLSPISFGKDPYSISTLCKYMHIFSVVCYKPLSYRCRNIYNNKCDLRSFSTTSLHHMCIP